MANAQGPLVFHGSVWSHGAVHARRRSGPSAIAGNRRPKLERAIRTRAQRVRPGDELSHSICDGSFVRITSSMGSHSRSTPGTAASSCFRPPFWHSVNYRDSLNGQTSLGGCLSTTARDWPHSFLMLRCAGRSGVSNSESFSASCWLHSTTECAHAPSRKRPGCSTESVLDGSSLRLCAETDLLLDRERESSRFIFMRSFPRLAGAERRTQFVFAEDRSATSSSSS